jgi:chorismate synthase
MNSFGRIFRLSVFGESHGPIIGLVLDGVPPGLPLNEADFQADIARRKPGAKGTTPRIESDLPRLKTGVFQGYTTGAPLMIEFENANTQSKDYSSFVHTPRPGHADFVARQRYKGFNDYRGGGHFSGRLTLLLVAAGVVAKKVLGSGVRIQSQILEIGGETDLERGLAKAVAAQDSIGGLLECRVRGLGIGLGEPFFDSVESVLAHLLFSIPAVKGVEFGSGFAAAKLFGSQHNDALIDEQGHTASNHAGGIVGGLSNGNELVVRIAVKPTSSTPQVQQTYNFQEQSIQAFKAEGRHDLCIALRVPVVMEAVVALGLADLLLIHRAWGE